MKEILKSLVLLLPNKWQVWLNVKVRVGYFPNLNHPKSFNEKVQHRKLYDHNPLFVICSDKYAVREYVREKIGEEYLIPLLYVGDSISESDLQAIDCDYVAKTTHDSGGIAIVKQGDKVDLTVIVKTLKKSLGHDFGKQVMEPWYSKIKAKIIVEKMLKNEAGNSPDDYKFHVFNDGKGNKKVLLAVDYDRFSDDQSRTFYDENGNILPFGSEYKNKFTPLRRIENFNKLISLAKQLAEDFEYVRVDFYIVKETIFFGELTFAPGSGYTVFSERKYDFELGSFWKLRNNLGKS